MDILISFKKCEYDGNKSKTRWNFICVFFLSQNIKAFIHFWCWRLASTLSIRMQIGVIYYNNKKSYLKWIQQWITFNNKNIVKMFFHFDQNSSRHYLWHRTILWCVTCFKYNLNKYYIINAMFILTVRIVRCHIWRSSSNIQCQSSRFMHPSICLSIGLITISSERIFYEFFSFSSLCLNVGKNICKII